MKKSLSLLLAVLVLIPLFMLTACGVEEIKVESVLTIDSEFSGCRSIVVKFPRNIKIDKFKDKLISNNPLKDSKTSKFEYIGVEKDGYAFKMDIVFSSHDDYLAQVEKLINRDVTAYFSVNNTVFTKGLRLVEDFDVSELIAWINDLAQDDDNLKKTEFDYVKNIVSFSDKEYKTGTTIDISERSGLALDSITIETTNLKDGNYNRTLIFSIPNKTYMEHKDSIERYFSTRTMADAYSCEYIRKGSSWEYKVVYKDLSLNFMSLYTTLLLNSNHSDVFYGERDNSTTPLSEGLVFGETLDTSSYINSEGNSINLVYKYILPEETTHGEGMVYNNGKWVTDGAWKDGMYTLVSNNDFIRVRVPDGIQYSINGIRFNLNVRGKDNFVRTTEFLYSKTQGYDGMAFAKEYFEKKGAKVETDEDKDNMICRVVCSGTSEEITNELKKYFGKGNFMSFEVVDKKLSLSQKTHFSEKIDLSHILNSINANRPMKYTVTSDDSEKIYSLVCGDSKSTKSKNSEMLVVDVNGGTGSVTYSGNIPKTFAVVVYCFVSAALLIATVYWIMQMMSYQRYIPVQNDAVNKSLPSLTQTTTFNISDINMLAESDDIKFDDLQDDIINDDMFTQIGEKTARRQEEEKFEFLHRMMTPEGDSEKSQEIKPEKNQTEEKDIKQYEEEYFYNV